MIKTLPAHAGDVKRCRFGPWVGKIPWRRAWKPTPVFLPGESHGQRSLVGCSPWGHTETDMTERLSTHSIRKIENITSDSPKNQGIKVCLMT